MKTKRYSIGCKSAFRNPKSAIHRHALRFEPLESRSLLTGVVFDSVMTFGDGTNPTSVYGGVAVDDAGNKVVTGYFQGTVDFDPGHTHPGDTDTLQAIGSGDNLFVAKYDADGLLSWVRGMGGAATQSGQNAHSEAIKIDDAGDVYIAGTFQATVDFGGISLTSAGGDDVFLAKLTEATGDVAWALRFGDAGVNSIADNALALGNGQAAYLAIGDVLKVDTTDGAIVWQKEYAASSVAADEAGSLFLAKQYSAPFDADPGPGVYMINHDPSPTSVALLKVNASGDLQWARVLETSGTNAFTTLLSMTTDGSGNVFLAGYHYGTVDFDPSPTATASLPASQPYYVTKFDTAGQLVWAKPLIGEITPRPGEQSSTLNIDLSADSSGNLYATGSFRGVVDLDPGSSLVSFTSQAVTYAFDSYLTSLTSDGQFRWGTALGNVDASISVLGMAIDANHGLHLGGSFYGPNPIDFDPGAAIQQVTSVGRSGFLLKLNPTPGVTVSRSAGFFTQEAATTASFAVTLDSAPTANVTIPVATSDSTEGITNVSSLTFTPANWQVPQFAQVTGVDDAIVDGNVNYTVVLGAAVSADSQYNGVEPADVSVVNLDDDVPSTRFYVVDDASANKTFEYSATGSTIENYGLSSGNAAPRGAASTAAGDKVWVVDANKKVYVYNTSGGLLGFWTAGTLPSNANVQGVATNGTDVWIVDARGDKVYRYTGAASRFGGSQNAASSFALNSSNKDATDLVTDGTSIWVLNNTSSADKVFKYSLSGTLQGSWTVSNGGGSPTGLTIDPSGASSSIWIVDSASDRVYEFSSARSRTSGSQSPATNFALASGNTNPQGIADPPTSAGAPSSLISKPSPTANDAALLSVTAELERLLAPSGKKRN